MKTLFITTFLFVISLGAFSQTTDKYFELNSATSQNWAGGAAGSGSGTYYNFYITLKKDIKITFDSVWITGGYCLKITENENPQSNDTLKNSYVLNANIYVPYNYEINYGNNNYTNTGYNPPYAFKGAALISFHTLWKTYYFEVKDIQSLAPIAYP